MKMITEKQKKFINDIKGVITENGINAIDALDLNKFTCYDASKLIGGLLGLFIDFSHGLPTQQLVGYRVILFGVNHLGGVNLYFTNKSGFLVPDIDDVS